jgi:hypothetical protein
MSVEELSDEYVKGYRDALRDLRKLCTPRDQYNKIYPVWDELDTDFTIRLMRSKTVRPPAKLASTGKGAAL